MWAAHRTLVTRRLLLLAMVFTLVPAMLTAGFAVWMLRQQTIEHATGQLAVQAQNYGLSLRDRMNTLQSSLVHWQSGHLASDSLPLGVSRLIELSAEQAGHLASHLSENQIKGLRLGRSLLLSAYPGPAAMGRMAVLMQGQGHWRVALVDESFLWGPVEFFPSGVFLCVRDQAGLPLHCPRPRDMALRAVQDDQAYLPRIERLLSGAAQTELGEAWAPASWNVVASQKTGTALAPMPAWQSIFMPSVLLACLVTIFLVFVRIRSRMQPLAQLSAATSRLAAGDFDISLKIETGDEFERLGESLNRMSRRLGYQVGALRALADMDRLILAGEGIEPLVRRAMDCLVATPGVDRALLLLAPEDGESAAYRSYGPGDCMDIIESLSYGQFARIMGSRLGANGRCLDAVGLQAVKSILGEGQPVCLPVLLDESLIGVLLVIGERKYASEEEQLRHMMRDLADRIAVAISSLRRKELLFRQAHFDSLTELPNRELFKDRLDQALGKVLRSESLGALMFLDLDRFKAVNDSEGHSAGDLLLVEAARRLRANLRASDTVARLGGDEFTVVLSGVHSSQEAARIADEMLAHLSKPFIVNEVEHFVGASIGITIFPSDGRDVEQLIRNADTAMYQAKNMGGGAVAFYNSDMNRRARERRALETDLRHALERNEFVLFYQPQVDMSDGRVVGAEALLRWQHPERGLVGPGEFVPVAEETGLIVPIGDWVIQTACREFQRWKVDSELPLESISINTSLRQFRRREIVHSLRKALETTAIDPAAVEVEITESVLAEDVFEALGVLNMIHRLGVRIGIDDFGTGYSSLGYLKRFPFDTLKIDRVFLSDIPGNRESQAIAEAVIAIARTLNKRIVAEGVETGAQLDFVRASGCAIAQGLLLGRPMSADAFLAWSRTRQGRPEDRGALQVLKQVR